MNINKVFISKKWVFVLINEEEIRRYKTIKTLIMCLAKQKNITYKECSENVYDLVELSKSVDKEQLKKMMFKRSVVESKKPSLFERREIIGREMKKFLSQKNEKYIVLTPNQMEDVMELNEVLADLPFRDFMTIQNYLEVLKKARLSLYRIGNKKMIISKIQELLNYYDSSPPSYYKFFLTHLLYLL